MRPWVAVAIGLLSLCAVLFLVRRLVDRSADARRRSRLSALRAERVAHLTALDPLLAGDAVARVPPDVATRVREALRAARTLAPNEEDDAVDDALLELRVVWEREGGTPRSPRLEAWDRTMSELQNAISFLRGLLPPSG